MGLLEFIRLSFNRSRTPFALCILVLAPQILANDWVLNEFHYRHRITIDGPTSTSVCFAHFAHHGLIKPNGEDIRVTDAAGKIVNHELLQFGPGDQADILFDCGQQKSSSLWFIYFGNSSATEPKAWKAPAGVVLEVRKRAEGKCDNWDEFQKMFTNSTVVEGKTLRLKIFDGYNPLGPDSDFVSYYRAHFHIDRPGIYKFATNSNAASFLLVNGHLVAMYPGWHNADANMGQHSGIIDLTAGVHKLEYYHVHRTDGESITLAAWQRPTDNHFTLMQDGDFVSITRAQVHAIEQLNGNPMLDFFWTPIDHLVVNQAYMIRCSFQCWAQSPSGLIWDFGDGSPQISQTEEERKVKGVPHIFLTPGTFTVTLKSQDGSLPPATQKVVVAPVWNQREEFEDNRWKDYRISVLARFDNKAVSPAATATALTFAIAMEDKQLLSVCAATAWELHDKFSAEDQPQVFFKLGMKLQSELKDYQGAYRAFTEVINGPGDTVLKERSKLHRSGLMIHMLGKNTEALNILDKISDNDLLAPNEPILRQIFMADATASLGKRDEAVKIYQSLRPIVSLADRQYALGRRGRLLAIGAYIKRGDFHAALDELRNIEWETPLERISDETGMLRSECYLAEHDYQMAVILLDRLLKVNPASARRPEMLLNLIKAFRGLNQEDLVQATFAKLKKEHPYAEETALASMLLPK